MAKLSVSAGARAAGHAVSSLLENDLAKKESSRQLWMKQLGAVAKELGELKGSLMKAGQALSMYGEYFLPPELNQMLKSLQNASPPVEWRSMEKVLNRQWGLEKKSRIEVETEPFASASIGQVHLGTVKADGRRVAIKIQYPGVDQAIDSDLSALKRILSLSKLLPIGERVEGLFVEVRKMLHQEVDYGQELEFTREFSQKVKGDSRYVVPLPVEEFCTKRVMVTEFQQGFAVDSPEVEALSQERRNALGASFLELYLRELFEWSMMQTDPHFGNYRVQLDPDSWVLLDFGAVRRLPKSFIDSYLQMVRGCFSRDEALLLKGAKECGFIWEGDEEKLERAFIDLCLLITEPFDPELQPYDWGQSDLPRRVTQAGAELVMSFKLRPPPSEILFLDRKMGGVFIVMNRLKVKINNFEIAKKYL